MLVRLTGDFCLWNMIVSQYSFSLSLWHSHFRQLWAEDGPLSPGRSRCSVVFYVVDTEVPLHAMTLLICGLYLLSSSLFASDRLWLLLHYGKWELGCSVLSCVVVLLIWVDHSTKSCCSSGTCLLFDHHLSFAHSCMEQVKLGPLGPGLEGAAVTTKTMGQYLSVHISYAFSSFVIVYNRNIYKSCWIYLVMIWNVLVFCSTKNENPETELGFNLKTRKAKQPTTRESYLYQG